MSDPGRPKPGPTLDPENWSELRALGHRMLDDMLDQMAQLRERPVWTQLPDEVRASFREALPSQPMPLDAVYSDFQTRIEPYSAGNTHPRFMGWVQGGGTAIGALAEMLAAGMNANCGGRDHAAIEVERQIARWSAELFGFPGSASGIFVTGTSIANFIAVTVARTARLGIASRRDGIAVAGQQLTAYVSTAAHGCIRQAMDLAGFGSAALRLIPTVAAHRIDLAALRAAIARDRAAGATPFFLVGNAGTVDTGAIDGLEALASLAAEEKLWFHIDGALGALAMLSQELRPRFKGIEHADSIAFDFHKFGQIPYDAGFILVRDSELHRDAFATQTAYLRREARGLAGGSPWPCDFGPDLSRGFRALKTWFTLKAYGSERIGAEIARSCELARYLERRVAAEPRLELLAPAALNIVCFRYRASDPDRLNAAIVAELHERGIAAPSTTTIDGRVAIRASLINHRIQPDDIDALLAGVLDLGQALSPG
ncbi:MAG TPA: pyridoxal-dependent decarboxylase [Stellaceae bacterium]|jgi:aromatic-L-amino-acid/L-tryptophan decarboxylase|nr:pyridoxal-dependent decarboxylase [Stellaceae bacterium]